MRSVRVLFVAVLLVGAGCSSSSSSTSDDTSVAVTVAAVPLRLDDVQPAVAAVEAALGGPQQYTEINVQADLVNLFVGQPDGTELAYVYRNGALEAPDAPAPQQEGAVLFSLDGVPLDRVGGFDDLLAAQLPDSTLVRLTLTAAAAGGVQWTASLLGAKGTPLDVLISPAGAILGVLPG